MTNKKCTEDYKIFFLDKGRLSKYIFCPVNEMLYSRLGVLKVLKSANKNLLVLSFKIL